MGLEGLFISILAGMVVQWLSDLGVKSLWKRRVRSLLTAINAESTESGRSVKDNVRHSEYGRDTKVLAQLDTVEPKTRRVPGGVEDTPRVSLGKKILDGALDAIPLVSLFRK